MKIFLNIIKKIVMSYILLYGYNLIAVEFNMVIPINLFNIVLLTIFGIPSLLFLLLLKVLFL